MAISTKALVAWKAGSQLQLQEIRLDELRSDECRVRISAVGICHADISCLDGKIPVPFPCVLGHEGAGVIEAVGSEITGVAIGDKVLLSYNCCGDCVPCITNHPAYCNEMSKLNFGGVRRDGSQTLRTVEGLQLHGSYFGQSSFSHLAIVNQRCLVKVSKSTPLELFAPIGCSVQTGVGTIFNILDVQPGDTVAIFGVGAVGLAAVMGAKARGAKTIICIDLVESRLESARRVGATHTINGDSDDVAARVSKICDADGVMHALDATGVPKVVETMIHCLGTLGRAATVGAPAPGSQISIDVFKHLVKGRQYVGSNQGDAIPQTMLPKLIELHAQGKLPIEEMVKQYKVEAFAEAISDVRSGKTIKAVLIWP